MDITKQESYLKHFPEVYSEKIKDYMHENLFKHYIFTDTKGFCTHCGEFFELSKAVDADRYLNGNLKHNGKGTCPHCKTKCTVKNANRGHKTMIDEVYCIYYEKSVIDPKVMVARGIYAVRDYRGDYTRTETAYGTKAFYYYEMGNTAMFERYVYYSNWTDMREGEISERKKFNSFVNMWPCKMSDIITGCCLESVANAVKDTPFQYSCYDNFDSYGGYVEYFDLYSRYPVIEKLAKIGFKEIIETKLYNNPTWSSVNWRADTVQKALRLNRNDIKSLKSFDVDCRLLRLYQISKKSNANLTLTELKFLHDENVLPEEIHKLLKYVSFRKLFNYTKKQSEISKNSIGSVLRDYKDYLEDCVDLEKDLTKKSVIFPKDLIEAHEATTKQIKHKKNAIIEKKISDRAKELEKYCFEFNGLLIRPAASQTELIKEGDALNHCVGRYAERIANEKTNIFFIRKVNQPNKPFFTAEIRANKLIQCRGNRNKDYSSDKNIKAFMDAFILEKLTNKSKSKTA